MLASLSRAQLGAGEIAEAVHSAEEAVAIAQQRGQHYWELSAQLALAAALAASRGARRARPSTRPCSAPRSSSRRRGPACRSP